jgi:MerR family transcriptional regulator/heat shock protein HspR
MPRDGALGFEPSDADQPVFVISVAAQLTGMHPQTLRGYDRIGLVSPGRTGGGGRRYSLRDIELLRTVAELTSSGIGIEGVRRILELEHQVDALRSRVAELQSELASTHRALVDALRPHLPVVRAGSALARASDVPHGEGPGGRAFPAPRG